MYYICRLALQGIVFWMIPYFYGLVYFQFSSDGLIQTEVDVAWVLKVFGQTQMTLSDTADAAYTCCVKQQTILAKSSRALFQLLLLLLPDI